MYYFIRQQLSLPNEEILFCNRYLLDTYPPSGNKCLQVQEQQSSGPNEEHIYGRWTCPCLKGNINEIRINRNEYK